MLKHAQTFPWLGMLLTRYVMQHLGGLFFSLFFYYCSNLWLPSYVFSFQAQFSFLLSCLFSCYIKFVERRGFYYLCHHLFLHSQTTQDVETQDFGFQLLLGAHTLILNQNLKGKLSLT